MKTSTAGRALAQVSSFLLSSHLRGPNKDVSKQLFSVSTTYVTVADTEVSVRKSRKHKDNLPSSYSFARLSIYLETNIS